MHLQKVEMPKSKDHHLNQENTLLRVSESLNRSLTQTDLIGATYQKSLTYSTLPFCGFLSLSEFAEVEGQALNAMENTKRTATAWSSRVLASHLELKSRTEHKLPPKSCLSYNMRKHFSICLLNAPNFTNLLFFRFFPSDL